MEFSEKNNQLTIIIEDDYEWLEMFDRSSKSSNIIEISINKTNVDFFFPNRKFYINDDDIEQRLIDDANRFETIRLVVADDVMDKNGKGVFEVNGFDFDLIQDPDEERFALPREIENGDFAVIAYIVSPEPYSTQN